MSSNQYGLDNDYFERKIAILHRDGLKNWKPDELARELARMSRTADKSVMHEAEFAAPVAERQSEGKRERFQKWVLAMKHPVLGFLDGHWLERGDDREGYANEYVQGLWVAYKEFCAPTELAELQATIDRLTAENERIERNRDMWKGQVEQQAGELEQLRTEAREWKDTVKFNDGCWREERGTMIDKLQTARAEIERLKDGQGEPVAWQFYQDGKWWNGQETNSHRENTEGAGYPIRDLFTSQPAPVSVDDPCEWSDGQILDFLGVALRNVDLSGEVKLSEIRQGFEYVRHNACLDAVAALNTTRPSRANAPADSGTHPHNDGLDDYRGKV